MMHYVYPRNRDVWELCSELMDVPHVLISGACGSGKSVLINSFIYSCLAYSPNDLQLVLLDPKRIELKAYKRLPDFVLDYSSEIDDCIATLEKVIDEMEDRYKYMDRHNIKTYDGSDIYVVIDEFADLVVQNKKAIEKSIIRIAQLGRASKIHLILGTQRTTRDILNGTIKVNLDYRIALHTPTAIDSRNIIDEAGAEKLHIGEGLYFSPNGIKRVPIPMTPEKDIEERVNYWRSQMCNNYISWRPKLKSVW